MLTFLFCGVESTGKSTAIENSYKYLTGKGYKVQIVSEVGREVCANSGGVFEMSLLDYEQILYLHQANFLKAYSNNNFDIILLDTDSTYTRYYLEKDEVLLNQNKELCNKLIKLSESISSINKSTQKINQIIYLNPDCPFVQDGTRTYEDSRYEDDKVLFNLYQSLYKETDISIIKGKEYEDRTNQIFEVINKKLSN